MDKLSVIIGRFQTPYLHKGHLKLIEEAKKASEDILILIGCTAATGTDKNPLDFETREKMFYEIGLLSNPLILPLNDMPSDKDWSNRIDLIIKKMGYEEAVIFGGRDNSIKSYYSGKHEIKILDKHGDHSATNLRKEAAKEPMQCPNFRSGIIHHVENRYPIVYSTVDIAVYKTITIGKGWQEIRKIDSILMGIKGDKFNFIGGFVDPEDESLDDAINRELNEETGITVIKNMTYEFSHKIDDPRYLGSKDCIMTHFFSAESVNSELPDESKIQDKEFKEFKWMPANKSSLVEISDTHKSLFTKFINQN